MPAKLPPAPWAINAAPVVPAGGGQLTSALAVSLLLHVTVALIGVEPSDRAAIKVQRGEAAPPTTLTLSLTPAAASQQPPTRITLPPVGEPDAPRAEPERPAMLPEQPLLEVAEIAAVLQQVEQTLGHFAAPPPQGRPAADQPPPEPAVTAEPEASGSDAAEPAQPAESAPAAASQATASNDAPAGAQVDVDARPLPDNLPPDYPPAAIQQGRQGRAVLRVSVDIHGAARDVAILRSSGHADLDREAVQAVAQWRFVPAQRQGQPVPQTIAVPIRFLQP